MKKIFNPFAEKSISQQIELLEDIIRIRTEGVYGFGSDLSIRGMAPSVGINKKRNNYLLNSTIKRLNVLKEKYPEYFI